MKPVFPQFHVLMLWQTNSMTQSREQSITWRGLKIREIGYGGIEAVMFERYRLLLSQK